MDDFELELKKGFLDEASQGIEEVEQCFLVLESTPNDVTILDKIFRLAHNLKGSSKAVGFNQLGEFTHVFESLLLKIKNNEISVSKETVSLLLQSNDHIKHFIEQLRADLSAQIDSTALLAKLESAIRGEIKNDPSTVSPANTTTVGNAEPKIELEVELKVESVPEPVVVNPITDLNYNESLGVAPITNIPAPNLFAEDPPQSTENVAMVEVSKVQSVPASPPPPQTASSIATIGSSSAVSEAKKSSPARSESGASDESIRVSLAKLEKLINYVGEMVILQTVLREQANVAGSHLLRKSVHQMGRVSKEIQDLSMGLRMLPIKPIFQKMQRIVRDTSNALNKKIEFHIDGEETAVDKTVLDLIGDPLVHLVRNAVDHGIESAEKRLSANKAETGTIHLRSFHRGDKLVLEVEDDGGGINPEIIAKKAIEKKVISENHNLTRDEIIHLVFHPGFSTKAQTTEVSGRGVGMDVVKTNIESMQGLVEIETTVGKGSVFRIILPLTLAIVDGMVLQSQNDFYIVPLSQVRDAIKPKKDQVQFNKGVGETLLSRGQNIPLYRLDHVLQRGTKPKSIDNYIVVVIKGSQCDFGLVVDDIVNQQQVVIKKLGVELQGISGFSGSAILGSGRPALIVEPNELVQHFLTGNQVIDLSQRESI